MIVYENRQMSRLSPAGMPPRGRGRLLSGSSFLYRAFLPLPAEAAAAGHHLTPDAAMPPYNDYTGISRSLQ